MQFILTPSDWKTTVQTVSCMTFDKMMLRGRYRAPRTDLCRPAATARTHLLQLLLPKSLLPNLNFISNSLSYQCSERSTGKGSALKEIERNHLLLVAGCLSSSECSPGAWLGLDTCMAQVGSELTARPSAL